MVQPTSQDSVAAVFCAWTEENIKEDVDISWGITVMQTEMFNLEWEEDRQ